MATLQELIDLTPEQEKAWNRLVKAVKDFRAAGGKFYSVLDTLSAYNGEHVASIDNDKATTLQASICLALMRLG
ncbi:hypothetical protein SS17_3315 [Escherichia coli O157:H7 str. SS17]|nr:hypothetical protein SS17_3315 [Escherichia coli O157:H7 str. SS17]